MPLPPPSRRYISPVVVISAKVMCEVRGLVRIAHMSAALIPWPIGEKDGEQQLIVYKGLATAVRSEQPETVADWWGVPVETVTARREQLGEPSQSRLLKWERKQVKRGRLKKRRRRGIDEQSVAPPVFARKKRPKADRPASRLWEPWEDELVRQYAPAVVVVMTGRSLTAVYGRRRDLGCSDGRKG